MCNPKDIPIPEMDIIISAEKYVLEAFKGKKSLSIIPYEKYPSSRINIASYESYEKKTKYWRDKYIESLYNTFIYEHYNEDGFDILTYKQSYLKQKNNAYLPSVLIFNSPPEKIRYEIQSKYAADIVTGEIQIKS
ncbi:hypothetical protein ACSQ7W_07545 [Bacillus halotolerans]|uniref:hypothetical protein n=1 Tax=Bacillus halotolerans TaxID=260554 RepID=UPI00403FA353